MISLPFRVDHEHGATLTEQIYAGLFEAIQSGSFAPGCRLPGIHDMSRELGASVMVVRNAVRRLVERGLVSARPRAGITVLDAPVAVWRRHVLHIMGAPGASGYFFTIRNAAFQSAMDEKGFRLSSIHIHPGDDAQALRRLQAILDTQAIHFALVDGTSPAIAALLDAHGIAYGCVTQDKRPAGACGTVRVENAAGDEALAAYIASLGVRSVCAVTFRDPEGAAMVRVFKRHGIAVRVQSADSSDVAVGLEAIERAGYEAVRDLLSEDIPECLYIADDYVARGGVMAVVEAGVDVPGQMQLITSANRGHAPFFPKALTHLEIDPAKMGSLMADLCDRVLTHGRLRPELGAVPRVVVGATTCAKR